MVRIAYINTYCDGSTASLVDTITSQLDESFSYKKFYGRLKKHKKGWTYIGKNKFLNFVDNFFTFIFGKIGHFHFYETKKLIRKLKDFDPDIIHFQNLHGNYLNFLLLGKYLSSFRGQVIFTLHDQFLLTGRCALISQECNKWQTGCCGCKNLSRYPRALIDKSKRLHLEKLRFFEMIRNPIFVCPSKWMLNIYNSSLLSKYKAHQIYNGVIGPFKYCKQPTKQLLFVANPWSKEKGSEVINQLFSLIDRNKYTLLVVGVDSKTKELFDPNIKTIGVVDKNTINRLFSESFCFVNPTFLDNLPTVLIESIQNGCPCVTFDTGGCSEIVNDNVGVVVKEKTAEGIIRGIMDIERKSFVETDFKQAFDVFSAKNCSAKYKELYLSSLKYEK